MAGFQVNRDLLDIKAAELVMRVRDAFRDVETLYEWLALNPVKDGVDPLTVPTEEGGKFGYTDDEAYLIRYVVEGFHGLSVQPLLHAGRALTGLS